MIFSVKKGNATKISALLFDFSHAFVLLLQDIGIITIFPTFLKALKPVDSSRFSEQKHKERK